jgi:hypothetical protein
MTGRTVRLDGFVTPGPDEQPVLARIVVTCCAADGRPVKVGLTGTAPTGLAAGTWIQADGTYTGRTGTDPKQGQDPVPHGQRVAGDPHPPLPEPVRLTRRYLSTAATTPAQLSWVARRSVSSSLCSR